MSPEAREKRRLASAEWWRINGPAYREKNRAKLRDNHARHREENREVCNSRSARWREENPDRQRAAEIAYRANNQEKRQAACKAYRQANPEKEKAYRQQYAEANKPKLAAKAARRRAAQLQATPAWANEDAIAAFYAEAARITAETGIEHHVDHIIPLQSKFVCGLHCEANLQILEGLENISKNNRMWPDQ